MQYEFGGSIYNTKSDFCKAIAESWITAGGNNSEDFIKEMLEQTDHSLAMQLLDTWSIGHEDVSISDIEQAFSDIRSEI